MQTYLNIQIYKIKILNIYIFLAANIYLKTKSTVKKKLLKGYIIMSIANTICIVLLSRHLLDSSSLESINYYKSEYLLTVKVLVV